MTETPVGRILTMAATFALVVALGAVSFVWSFQQTWSFTTTAIGVDGWGFALAVIIQFGPTAILVFAKDARGVAFIVMIVSAALLTAIDAWTNVGEMGMMYGVVATPAAARWLGWILSVSVVAAEEFMAFFIVKGVDQLAHFLNDAGREPPQWLYAVQGVSRDAYGAGAAARVSGRGSR